MLVELGLVEQRLQGGERSPRRRDRDRRGQAQRGDPPDGPHLAPAVCELGASPGWSTRPRSPRSCPHQMTPVVEARIVEMRRTHPGWGPRTIRTHLAREGVTPLPGRSSIYRALVRHRLLEPDPSQAVPVGLQAVGALEVHGALADGHRRPVLSGRRHRGEGGHRRRRPQPLLRLCPDRGPGHGQAGL